MSLRGDVATLRQHKLAHTLERCLLTEVGLEATVKCLQFAK
jgi:hypothetical protein